MPNYVTHNLSIKGEVDEIKRFITKCFTEVKDKKELDFESLIPMPNILEKTVSGNSSEMQTKEYMQIQNEAIAQTGHKDWYNWRLEKWGTKWNAYHTSYENLDTELILWFDTAWACPEPFFRVLGEEFPSLMFEGYAIDEGNLFAAVITITCGMFDINYMDVDSDYFQAFKEVTN